MFFGEFTDLFKLLKLHVWVKENADFGKRKGLKAQVLGGDYGIFGWLNRISM